MAANILGVQVYNPLEHSSPRLLESTDQSSAASRTIGPQEEDPNVPGGHHMVVSSIGETERETAPLCRLVNPRRTVRWSHPKSHPNAHADPQNGTHPAFVAPNITDGLHMIFGGCLLAVSCPSFRSSVELICCHDVYCNHWPSRTAVWMRCGSLNNFAPAALPLPHTHTASARHQHKARDSCP